MKYNAIIMIASIIIAFSIYMMAWSKRMMPNKAAVSEAVNEDDGKIIKIREFHLWTKILGRDSLGLPIVFIPGGLGLKSRYLEEAFLEISKTNPVIFYDPRGCGRSESKEELQRYTWQEFSEELYALIQWFYPNRKVILSAHSCGCCILYRFLKDYSDTVEKVMLLSCMVLKYEAKMPNIFKLIRHFPSKNPEAANKWFESYVKTKILFGNLFAYPENLEKFDTRRISMIMCTNINVKINKPYDYTGLFKRFKAPVLILTGNDKWEWASTNNDCAKRIEKEFSNASRYAFENSGHFFFLEEKEKCLEVIKKFIYQDGEKYVGFF